MRLCGKTVDKLCVAIQPLFDEIYIHRVIDEVIVDRLVHVAYRSMLPFADIRQQTYAYDDRNQKKCYRRFFFEKRGKTHHDRFIIAQSLIFSFLTLEEKWSTISILIPSIEASFPS